MSKLTSEDIQAMAERNQRLNMLKAKEAGPGTALAIAGVLVLLFWAWFWL